MTQTTMGQSWALIKTKEFLRSLPIMMTAAILGVSCTGREHLVGSMEPEGVPVTIRVATLEQVPFAHAATKGQENLQEACSVINYAIYNMSDGKLDKQINQKASDDQFGTLNLKLEEGSYHLVVVAHNGDANATMTDRSKITFQNNSRRRITDTFLYSSDISVAKDMQPLNLNLDRVVTKVELRLVADSVPPSVETVEFEIGSGGSSGLNTLNGYGTRSTKYTDKISVSPGDTLIEVYTFVFEGAETTKMTVTAKDNAGQEVKKILLENIPIARNRITRYSGVLFGKESINTRTSISVNREWAGLNEYPIPY